VSGLGPLAYLLGALVVGIAAIPSRLGLIGGFLLSLVLTPLGGLAVVLVSELLRPQHGRRAAAERRREDPGPVLSTRPECDRR
jgi:hypothetical protein